MFLKTPTDTLHLLFLKQILVNILLTMCIVLVNILLTSKT
jgi:hypothetical protein